LMFGNKFLQNFDQNGLDFRGHHLSFAVLGLDLFELLIVLEEESEVLVGDIDVEICSVLLMFFKSGTSSRESVFIDFLLDVLVRVGQEDRRGWVAGSHLLVLAEDRGEELGVDASRLEVLDSDSNVSGHSEVRVLIDALRDEAGNVGSLAENVGEGVGERGGGLDCRVGELTAVVALVDSEYALELNCEERRGLVPGCR
jgi:hypothetical protein